MKTSFNFSKLLAKAGLALTLVPGVVSAQAWISKHGMSPAEYQSAFTTNTGNGYRLTQVEGYTSNGAEKYIALWEKVSGGAYVTQHSMTASEFQTAFNTYTAQGYRLTRISGYTVNNVPQFAAIWEIKSGGAWVAKHNMTASEYQTNFNTYTAQGYRLKDISGYVVNGTEYFAAIWEVGSGGAWLAQHNLTAAQYQSSFNTYTSQGYFLKDITGYNKNGVDLYAAIWEKVSSPLWGARHGISSLNYQNAFDNYYYQGYRPKHLNAFASGSSAKFNCVWTNSAWSGTEIAKIDNAVNGYLSSQGVTGLSIAIAKDGRLVFAKGYGTANNSTGEELAPNHSMRIMSISKSVTAVGIMTLIQKGLMSKDDFVFGPGSILGSKYATPADKPSLNRIRVRQLLWHTSGLRTCNGENVFWDATKTPDEAMAVLLGATDLILTDTSGGYEYSNTNYFILERIIEQVSKQKYETYIRQNVLNQCGIGSSMFVGQSNGNPVAGEVSYTPVRNMNLQLWAGFGGWVARPKDLLKLLNRVDGTASPSDILSTTSHNTMTTGSAPMLNPGYAFGWMTASGNLQHHNGCYRGTRSFLVELGNGVSYAVIINSEPSNDGCSWTLKKEMEAGIKQILTYPSINLFDNTGSGAREFAITAADQVFDATMDISSVNKVIAYPTLSSDGIININNASEIKSIVVTDVLGNRESHKAGDKIQTQLKGILILHLETEQGKVTQKVIVE